MSLYADYAAAAPLRPSAVGAMQVALASEAGNPSSVHRVGARARALVETAREEVAAAIGAHPMEIVFTSGATEANNLALMGAAAARTRGRDGERPATEGARVSVAAFGTEHSSVLEPLRALAARGCRVDVLPVSAEGLAAVEAVAHAAPDVLSVALVNAETGVLQDCVALGRAVHGSGGIFHVDAAQAMGHVAVDVDRLGADLLTLSSPKVGAPAGVGALYVRRGTPVAPLVHGGPQERGLRPGTENVVGIAGFAAAVGAAVRATASEAARLAALTERLADGIVACRPGARVAGRGVPRAPHIVNVTFPGLVGELLVAAFDLEGVAISAGSACAAGAAEPSHVLLAMGWHRDEAASALRFSLGWASTAGDVDAILRALAPILARAATRRSEAAWPVHAS